MDENTTLMEFPCDFQIKIIGVHTPLFESEITAIVRKHFPATADSAINSKPSQKGNYLAISVTVHALDQKSLDALYMELTKHPDIKMVL